MLDYLLYRTGQFIVLHLPLRLGYRIAEFCADLHYAFTGNDRRQTKENLKAIFPKKPDKEIRKINRRIFRNFAKYLVDFFRFEKLNEEYIRNNIRVEDIHYFKEALSGGKGVIVLTAHIGNWELGGVVIALSGFPFWVVALPHKDKKVDEFFNFQRESKGIKVIPLGRAVRKSLEILKENKLLALVGDRDFSEKGIVLDFFGKPALFPQGPAALALKTGAAIVPGFMVRNADDTFTLKIESPLKFNPTGDKENDLRELVSLYKTIFESYIRKYPDQWYMFRRFWIS
ncbi:MAG: lysophospholipid acyltransferase family protein [Candidatus Omnitrophota bacterium]